VIADARRAAALAALTRGDYQGACDAFEAAWGAEIADHLRPLKPPSRLGKRDPKKLERDFEKALCRRLFLFFRDERGLKARPAFEAAISEMPGDPNDEKKVSMLWRYGARGACPKINRLAKTIQSPIIENLARDFKVAVAFKKRRD
jgi:hypothetical protein